MGQAEEHTRDAYLSQLLEEKENLGESLVHCKRLILQEIERVKAGGTQPNSPVFLSEKVVVPVKDFPEFNFVGRLLGPRGLTLKRMQTETSCKMTVMGRGSVRDSAKEEGLRNSGDSKFDHLKESLYVLVESRGSQGIAAARLAAGVAEVRKMLIPCEFDPIREEQLRELAVLRDVRGYMPDYSHAHPSEYLHVRSGMPPAAAHMGYPNGSVPRAGEMHGAGPVSSHSAAAPYAGETHPYPADASRSHGNGYRSVSPVAAAGYRSSSHVPSAYATTGRDAMVVRQRMGPATSPHHATAYDNYENLAATADVGDGGPDVEYNLQSTSQRSRTPYAGHVAPRPRPAGGSQEAWSTSKPTTPPVYGSGARFRPY